MSRSDGVHGLYAMSFVGIGIRSSSLLLLMTERKVDADAFDGSWHASSIGESLSQFCVTNVFILVIAMNKLGQLAGY